jgi:hypothetical protein
MTHPGSAIPAFVPRPRPRMRLVLVSLAPATAVPGPAMPLPHTRLRVFEAFADRMASEGPILPVADAEEVGKCFAEMHKIVLRQVYLQRVQQFRDAEGS